MYKLFRKNFLGLISASVHPPFHPDIWALVWCMTESSQTYRTLYWWPDQCTNALMYHCTGVPVSDQVVPKCSDSHYILASLLLVLLVGPHQIWLHHHHRDGRDGHLIICFGVIWQIGFSRKEIAMVLELSIGNLRLAGVLCAVLI